MQWFPRVVIHVSRLSSPVPELRELCERNLDLVIARITKQSPNDIDDLNIELLLHDRLVVAAGAKNPLAHRRKVDLADLVAEPWVLSPPGGSTNSVVMEACRARGLKPPNVCLMTYSVPLRMSLAARGPFLTVMPDSLQSLPGYEHSIKILPIDLPDSPTPLAIITLKNRKLNPVAERFIEHLRRYVASQSVPGAISSCEDRRP
jgi:DNA-binding transcriptional LysR family regulator